MEDAATPKSAPAAVGVTLFPSDYETVEMVTEQGEEILQQLRIAVYLLVCSVVSFGMLRTLLVLTCVLHCLLVCIRHDE